MTDRQPTVPPPLLVSHKEARQLLGGGRVPAISKNLFYELIGRGEVPVAVEIEGKRWFLRTALERVAAAAWSRAGCDSMRRGHENPAPSYGIRSRFLPEG